MILIKKNTENICLLTLSERTTIENAFYLVELKNDVANTFKYFILKVNSSSLRGELCSITENQTENVLNSVISLVAGFYQYKVYEQASATNLNPNGLNLVENGKLKVESELVVKPTYKEQVSERKRYAR